MTEEHLVIDPTLLTPLPNQGQILGGGCFATVFASRFENQDVAVKCVIGEDELEATKLCQGHPNVIRLLASTRFDNKLFLVLQRAEGGTLAAITGVALPFDARLRGADLARLLQQVASALHFVHERQLRHGDVAARNVLVHLNRQTAYLSDFGLTTRIGAPRLGKLPVFEAAPELLLNTGASVAADIYSFGVLMYEVFVGKRPYDNCLSTDEVRSLRAREPCLSCDQLEVDHDYAQVSRACLAFDPQQRPTASALVTLLGPLVTRVVAPADDLGYVSDGDFAQDNVTYLSLVQTATNAMSDQLRTWTEKELQQRGRELSRAWQTAESVSAALRMYESVRVDKLFGGFADTFAGIVFARIEIADARDCTLDRELREYAQSAKFCDDNDISRKVTRHVHCVRAIELDFFKFVHSRYVLLRDEPGQSKNVVERRTLEDFLKLLENDERRDKLRALATQTLKKYLPLDRAFALYAPRLDQETHWFSEQHASRLIELRQTGQLPAELEPIVARFVPDRTGARMSKMFSWLLTLAGSRAAARFRPFTQPLFWIKVCDQHHLYEWRENTNELVPYPTLNAWTRT